MKWLRQMLQFPSSLLFTKVIIVSARSGVVTRKTQVTWTSEENQWIWNTSTALWDLSTPMEIIGLSTGLLYPLDDVEEAQLSDDSQSWALHSKAIGMEKFLWNKGHRLRTLYCATSSTSNFVPRPVVLGALAISVPLFLCLFVSSDNWFVRIWAHTAVERSSVYHVSTPFNWTGGRT